MRLLAHWVEWVIGAAAQYCLAAWGSNKNDIKSHVKPVKLRMQLLPFSIAAPDLHSLSVYFLTS
jgi:hypothetical protein